MKSSGFSHRIRILGRELQVRSTASPERVRQIEDYINCKVEELEASSKCNDPQVVAILALLNIAESYFDLAAEGTERSKADSERISRLVRKIEDAIM